MEGYIIADCDGTILDSIMPPKYFALETARAFGFDVEFKDIEIVDFKTFIKGLGIEFDRFFSKFKEFDTRHTENGLNELCSKGLIKPWKDTGYFFDELESRYKIGVLSDNLHAYRQLELFGLEKRIHGYKAWDSSMPREWIKPGIELGCELLYELGFCDKPAKVLVLGDAPNDVYLGNNLKDVLDVEVVSCYIDRYNLKIDADHIFRSLREFVEFLKG
ncbi:hypothetical protein KY330_00380 [Candidatus Woesearchaeota archaeon]|nr:hypothetical protein [Candidatus Woesearchaeota archaeon]